MKPPVFLHEPFSIYMSVLAHRSAHCSTGADISLHAYIGGGGGGGGGCDKQGRGSRIACNGTEATCFATRLVCCSDWP